jgi:hypothetical protein
VSVVVVVLLDVESVVLVESPLLLQDQIATADKQMAKENNFFFIKWFLCVEVQKIYASPVRQNLCIRQTQKRYDLNKKAVQSFSSEELIQHYQKLITLFAT